MANNIVKCRACHDPIDKRKEQEGVDWVMPSKNWYYHKTCYEDWVQKKANDGSNILGTASDEEYFEMLYDYFKRDLKVAFDYNKAHSQWKSFLKKGMTAKGIFFCVKYFYEVKKGDASKAEGGIGIIPYIYEDGKQYWINRNRTDKGICEKIELQLKERRAREKVTVKTRNNKKKKEKIDLSMIAEMEDN